MKFKEFKNWIESLPDDFLDYEIEIAETGEIDENLTYRLDIPITGMCVNDDDKHVLLFIERYNHPEQNN
jgi:hypothetical protein